MIPEKGSRTMKNHPNVGEPLCWANEGQQVWAPKHDRLYILCVVTCAAGNHVRVKSCYPDKHDFEQWREVRDCFEFKPTVH